MKREDIKAMLPILQAFADGKVIQMLDNRSIWTDLTEREGLPIGTLREEPNCFRIKPEPNYRPFKDAEECWQEMLKHEPFGWVKLINNKEQEEFIHCGVITKADGVLTAVDEIPFPYDAMYKNYNFADGTPFGLGEE